MHHDRHRAGALAPALTPVLFNHLHRAACRSYEAPAILVALATIIPCDAERLAAVRIERIDWSASTLPVVTNSGGTVQVAVGFTAATLVLEAIGNRRSGFLVPDPCSGPLLIDDDAQDYACELLAAIDPRLAVPWSFRGIRETIVDTLLDHNLPYATVEAHAGLPTGPTAVDAVAEINAQRALSEWWCSHIGLASASPLLAIATPRGMGGSGVGGCFA